MPFAKPALRRYIPVLTLSGVYFCLCLALRIVLWGHFGPEQGVSVLQLPAILAGGLINDAIELLYLMVPLSLYLWLLPERWVDARWQRGLLLLGCYVVLFGMLYTTVAEFFFFEEFDARFNLVAVDYLIYPHEVAINIWESYPVSQVLLADMVVSALLLLALRPHLLPAPARDMPLQRRSWVAGGHAMLLGFAMATFSTHSLALTDNRVANELVSNGLSSFFQAFRTNELDYDENYRTGEPRRLLGLLRDDLAVGSGRFTDPPDTLTRRYVERPGFGRRNVVVIVEESFGAQYVGAYGARQGLTPNFDALANEGLLFTRTYASGTRTVRGLEAITLSFPPIPSESVVKRPGNETMANWGEVMRRHGYSTSFLYGGYSYFDNMGPFYRALGFEVVDRTDIEAPKFANIWGVSDEDLFDRAVRHFDTRYAQGKPFFSMIMTTSNHKPFTFPEGVPGVPTEGGGRSAGIRYADYALGHFFEQARAHAWYRDTLFVVVADHGARVYGRAQIPLESYTIPLLVLADDLKPGKLATLTSQLDIAPTVLGLLGLGYEAPFFGQDVLALHGREHGILFNHNHKVALYRNDKLAVLGLQESAHTYRYDPALNHFEPLPEDKELTELATAYFQTAFELFRSRAYH